MCPVDLGLHPLTREAQAQEVGVEVLQDKQVLVALDQFSRGNHLVIDWKVQGESGVPRWQVSPCAGAQPGQSR